MKNESDNTSNCIHEWKWHTPKLHNAILFTISFIGIPTTMVEVRRCSKCGISEDVIMDIDGYMKKKDS